MTQIILVEMDAVPYVYWKKDIHVQQLAHHVLLFVEIQF